MRVLRDTSAFPLACRGAVAALGNFDGLHRGHAQVIGLAVERARQAGVSAGVISFEPHPRRFFNPGAPSLRIITLQRKLHLLRRMGVDFLRILRFNRQLAQTSAEDFVTGILAGELGLSEVVTGEDFVFGRAREGDARSLARLAGACGIASFACPAVTVAGVRCSSTAIRVALAEGDMEEAARQLGQPYGLQGHVLHGDRRGRELGFPTTNLAVPRLYLPPSGVYAVRARVRGVQADGVANLGRRPTFAGTVLRLEAHLFDWEREIYGEWMEVDFLRFIRPESRFDGIDALKRQIASDAAQARSILSALP